MVIPRISVIIPAYNAEAHLPATVASVRRQTFTDWEMVIVDDGSRDGTAEVAADLASADRRIRSLSVPNGGVSRARNLGVAETAAPLIAFLDADDLWRPECLELHGRHFEDDPGLGVSYGRVELLTPAGEPMGKVCRTPLRPLGAAELLAENLTVTTSNWVVRRELFDQIGGFVDGLNHCEDLEWLLRVRCRTPWRIQCIDRVLTGYRTSSGGLSSQLARMEQGWCAMVDRVRLYAPDLIARHGAAAHAVQLRYLAVRAIRLGLPAGLAWDYLIRAFRTDATMILRQPRPTLSAVATLVVRTLLGLPRTLGGRRHGTH